MSITEQLRELIASVDGTLAVAAKNLTTGEEIMINEHEPFVAASVIKVPVMVEVFKQAYEGKLRLDQMVKIVKEDQVGGSGVILELTPGVELPIRDLVNLMIVVSDNSATNMLIDLVGAENVTNTMAELGLQNTKLYNKLMVIQVRRPGTNTITAWDMTRLFDLMAHGKINSWLDCERMITILKRQQYNDLIPSGVVGFGQEGLLGSLPRAEVAHKTGSINGVRHDSGIVYLPNATYALTILSKKLKDEAKGIETIRAISKAICEYWK